MNEGRFFSNNGNLEGFPAEPAEAENEREVLPDSRVMESEGRKAEVLFRFSAHHSERDAAGLNELLKTVDIYAPELRGWMPHGLKRYQETADGSHTPLKSSRPYQNARLEALRDSGVKVWFLDIPSPLAATPEDLPVVDRFYDLRARSKELLMSSFVAWDAGQFDKALTDFREYLQASAESQNIRETFISNKLKEKIGELPVPEGGAQIPKILVELGTAHTGVWHAAKSEDAKAIFEPHHPVYLYPYSAEARRKVAMNKEVDDDIIARSLLELQIDKIIPKRSEDSYKQDRLVRYFVSLFTFEEIKLVCEAGDGRASVIVSLLNAKKERLPRSLLDIWRTTRKIRKQERAKLKSKRIRSL